MKYLSKIIRSLPWLIRYPLLRNGETLSDFKYGENKRHLIFVVANHFEPGWKPKGCHSLDEQRRRLDEWYRLARNTGESTIDSDGTKFRHTNFYPGEQYDYRLLQTLAAMQAEGLGDVEIHLHHGVEKPDTAENLRRALTEFRDVLAEEHKCLSRFDGKGEPKYAFVHGNLALGNSAGGKYCGVNNELEILAETGCYVDMTLPTGSDETQIPVLNQIYECDLPLSEKMPHRRGIPLKAGEKKEKQILFPVIFTGPLVFNWTRRINGVPFPRIDDGALAKNQKTDLERLNRWVGANITIKNQPEWIFIKLYCHGFYDFDQSACIGEDAKRFFGEVVEQGAATGNYDVHFTTAREAFNMVLAAVDGKKGNPGDFRKYRLKPIMEEKEIIKSAEAAKI